jgi:hypothetical protein
MILSERPLFLIRKPHEAITEHDVLSALQQLNASEKQQSQCLRDNASRPFFHLTDALAENSFAISTIPPIHGLFLLHSRFNHSCLPNAKVPLPSGDTIALFATQNILMGEEITFCYHSDFEGRTRIDRHRELRFVCDCKACLLGTPFQKLSDLRRTFPRGLTYLTHGEDIDGKRHGSLSPIIIDPELKQAAETFSIPLTSRVIYNLLLMLLLEEEGLLDDFMMQRMNTGIVRTAGWFNPGFNDQVIKLAMAQNTWLAKFCVAFGLFGRKDPVDEAVAQLLQILKGSPSHL